MVPNIDFNLIVEVGQAMPVMAWFWLIPIGIAALVGGIAAVASSTNEVEGKELGVIGMTGAGKTQLYKTLKREEYSSYQGTATDNYDEFEFRYGDRSIKVLKGREIGGGDTYIKDFYATWIKERKIIFFVFDASRYINDKDYSKEVKARMDFIWRHMEDTYYGSKLMIKSKLVTIGSHLDKIDKSKHDSLLKDFQESVSGKPYSPMFHENFILANLTEHDKFMKELTNKKIFG